MNPPDKINVVTRTNLSDGSIVYTTVSKDFPNAKEYVSVNAILKWIKEQEKNLKYHTVSADAYQLALDMLKEEINRL